MPGHAFRAAIERGDLDAALGLLADDAVFKPYEGRENVEKILRAAYATFEDFRYTDELAGDGVHGVVFRARVGTKEVEGLDLIRSDDDGIHEFTVMIRPASALMAVAEQMGAKLAAAGVG